MNTDKKNKDPLFIECPHCKQLCEIIALNCRIFRCGIYKTTGRQVSPHAKREKCEQLVAEDNIYGCGKPFQIVKTEDNESKEEYKAIICDYI